MSKNKTTYEKIVEDVSKEDIKGFIKGFNELPKIIEGMKQVENSILLKMKSHNIDELEKVKIEKKKVPKNITIDELKETVASNTLLSMVLINVNFEETEMNLREKGYNDIIIIPFIEKLKNKLLEEQERLVAK